MRSYLAEKCPKCKVKRYDIHVFYECPCESVMRWPKEVALRIREDTVRFIREHINMISQVPYRGTMPIESLGVTDRIVKIMMSVEKDSCRLIQNSDVWKNELGDHIRCIDKARSEPMRLIFVDSVVAPQYYPFGYFIVRDDKDVALYMRYRYMTPNMSRAIQYDKCIYADEDSTCVEKLTGSILCETHAARLRQIHKNMIDILPADLMLLCLNFVVQECETAPEIFLETNM